MQGNPGALRTRLGPTTDNKALASHPSPFYVK